MQFIIAEYIGYYYSTAIVRYHGPPYILNPNALHGPISPLHMSIAHILPKAA